MTKTTLTDFFSEEQPFGPIAAPDPTIREHSIISGLFYKENLIYQEILSRPSLIIGRRGGGKTAFLISSYLNPKYQFIFELPPHKAFRPIVDAIEEMSKGVVFTEEVSDLWEMLFWSIIFVKLSQIKKDSDSLRIVRRYSGELGIRAVTNPYNIMRKMLKILKEKGGNKPIGIITELIDEMAFNDVFFTEAREAAINFMEEEKIHSIILLDSLEDFQLDTETTRHAISGLLRCQGVFHSPGFPFELRCCIPAEIYHELLEISSNPNKDFQQKLVLHWHASELIRLTAHRYITYLKLYHPDLYKQFNHLNMDKRTDAVTFWHEIFPTRIENRIGIVEDPIAYVIRHTQLLPRHLLLYLNAIAVKNLKEKGHPTQFQHKAVLDGILETEEVVCMEIFNGFKYIYPGAYEACKRCISYLPLYFEYGELHRVYNKRGKGIQGIFDFEDFKKMMIEIGAVGRVTKKTDRYVEGLFEYVVPHRLITSSYDELCLHPVFTEVFSAIKDRPDDKIHSIYPYGSDVDEIEYRDIS